MNSEQELTLELLGREIEVEVEFWYQAPVPGRYSGPPEDCYPDEPEEFEITDLRGICKDGSTVDLSGVIPLCHDEIVEAIKASADD